MSNKKQKSIVTRILAILNLTEEGKIGHFFDKAAKNINRNIESLKHNRKVEELNHAQELDKIEEQIEDAVDAVEAAYTNVQVERIQTNADQDHFLNIYFSRIEDVENHLKRLQKQKEDLVDAHKGFISDINSQISAYTDRLNKIS